VTPTLLCSREPQELHAGARRQTSLARHRMINLNVLLAAADRATREAVEAALELDAFFIVRGCVSGVEARTLAVAWPLDLMPLEAPA
jgi:hypothetical protein